MRWYLLDGWGATVLELRELFRHFRGMNRPAVDEVSLVVDAREILALAGPSGSGKTTLLRMIAGFERLDSGQILIGDHQIASVGKELSPESRRVGFVFQDFALFPHLTVVENVGFGLRGVGTEERRRRVSELLERAAIADLAERYPHEISGGQAQRVALLRALAPRPAVILLDEPFSSLDRACTHRVLLETRAILRESGSTAVVVTHDRYEAFTIADRVAVLDNGVLLQTGTPREIYARPVSRVVAEFSGTVSFIPLNRRDGGWSCALGPVPADVAVIVGDRGSLEGVAAVRTHQIAITPGDNGATARITETRFLGSVLAVHLLLGREPGSPELVAHLPAEFSIPPVGSQIRVRWASGETIPPDQSESSGSSGAVASALGGASSRA